MLRNAPMQRTTSFKFRTSEQEFAILKQLADHYQVNVAELIRLLARERHKELGLSLPDPKPVKRARRAKA